jgi:hypothetical protein
LPPELPRFDSPGHVDSIFRSGRLIALLSTLLASSLLALLVIGSGGYHLRGRSAILAAGIGGVLGGALLLTQPQVLVWATRFRGDMLMLALTAAGLTCVAFGAPPGGRAGRAPLLLLGAVFFALAFCTKQTALAGPAAAALYLLGRNWRDGLKWCAAMLALVAVPFALLDLATGHWFYLKMVVYHSLPYSWRTLTRLLHFALWDESWPLLLVAAAFSVALLLRFARGITGRGADGAPALIPLFFLTSVATLPTGGVVGADTNHLLMTALASCAAAGAFMAWALTEATPARLTDYLAPLGLILLAGYVVFTSAPSTVGYGPDLAYPSPGEQEQLRAIVQYMRTTPGDPFYSDDPGMVALAGKQTLFDDPFTMTALALQGRWDETAYRAMFREGGFVRLVLSCDVPGTLAREDAVKQGKSLEVARPCRADTYTPGVLDAIKGGYEVEFRDVFFTYRPR